MKHKIILKSLAACLLAISLLFPIQTLYAGASTGGSLTGGSTNASSSQSSSVSNFPSILGTGLPTNGSIANCLSPTEDPKCAGTGNPINVMTGNKYQEDTDMAALPGIMGIEIVRHYNSLHMGLGQIGYGWRLSYETNIYAVNNTLQIVAADGTRTIFNRDPKNPNACACQNPAQGHVMIYPGARGKEHTWFQLDGKQLHFNHQGKLERIRVATGESVHLTRGPQGELLKVTDPQGRSLIMHYADKRAKGFKGIIAIDSPVGRFKYEHDNDPKSPGISNLLSVRKPTDSKLERHYHYGESQYVAANIAKSSRHPAIPQAAHLLTGISHTWQAIDPKDSGKSITKKERHRTWVYDQLGRGILSVHGYPRQLDANGKRKPNTGIQQVDIRYQLGTTQGDNPQQIDIDKPYPRLTHNGEIGKTTITNSLGQETTYAYTILAGEYKLVNVIGAGCRDCSEPNMIYGYDKVGRLTHITKIKQQMQSGERILVALNTQQTDYDKVGRVKRVSNIAYIDGKPQPTKWLVRYEYPSTPVIPEQNAINGTQEPHAVESKPSLIAAQSLVAGKEHQWHITYNDYGQPLKVTETGYAPALSVAVSTLTETTAAIETRATQSAVNNSSADAHHSKQLTRTTTYSYSIINNRSLLTLIDGPLPNGKTNSPQDSDITQYQYNQRGELLTKVIHPLGLEQSFEYDDSGANPARHLVRQNGMDQQIVSYGYNHIGKLSVISKANSEISMAYDFNGRVIEYRRNDGNKIAVNYDDVDSTVTYTLADGQQRVQHYDTESRLISQNWQDAQGSTLINPSKIEYAIDTGKPSRTTSPSGLETVFNYDDNGALVSTQQGRKVNKQAFDPVSHLLAVKQNDALYTLQNDPEQSKLTLTLPNGAQHSQIMDDFGRIIMNQHPDSGIKIAEYDAANHTTAVYQLDVKTLSKQRSTHAQYDVLGRITEERHINHVDSPSSKPKGQEDNNTNTTDAEIISYQYQGTRLTDITSPAQATHYQYNAQGQLTQQTVTLKDANKVAQTQGQASKALTFTTDYTYDPFGRIQTVQLPEQALLTHQYNSIGQLANIAYQGPAHSWWLKAIRWVWNDYGTQPLITNIATNSVHGLTGFTHSNSLNANAKNNKAGQLVAWQDGKVSSQLQFNQEDKLESITQQTPQIPIERHNGHSFRKQPTTQTQALDYNVYGQLTQVNATAPQKSSLKETIKAAVDESYQLDLNGNRLSDRNKNNQDNNQQGNTYQYQPNTDRLLSVKGNHHTKYAYNSLGEPIQIQQQNQQTQLNRQIHYGACGQIASITGNGKPTASYQYNHARQRTHKQTQNQNTYYLWHGGLVDAEIAQTASSNKAHISKRYFYLGLKPVAVIDYDQDNQASVYAIHTDYLGTPQAITNQIQQVVWRAEYTPFGKTRNQQAVPLTVASDTATQQTNRTLQHGFISTANATTDHNTQKTFEFNLRFAGQYEDQETGYHYNWHRYYDPETGRYLTPDPIGLQGGMNGYAYTNHDPAMSVDPWGLKDYILGTDDPTIIPDIGSGPYASEQQEASVLLYKRGIEAFLETGMPAAMLGSDAVRHMQHYMNDTGSDLIVDMNSLMQLGYFTELYSAELELAKQFITTLTPGCDKKHVKTYQITSGNFETGNFEGVDKNWFYAIGGFKYWGKGTVQIWQGSEGNTHYSLDFEFKLYDRYNWDAGKGVPLPAQFGQDEFWQKFHRQGFAREYDIKSSLKNNVEGLY